MTQKKRATQSARKSVTEGVGIPDLVELSQQSTLATYRAAVNMQQAAGKLVQSIIETGVLSQEANLKATRAYIDALDKARQVWLDRAAGVTETFITISPLSFDYPYRKEIEQLGADAAQAVKKGFDVFTEPLRSAARS